MIDDVLRELEAVGTVESEGEFTMDRSKARDKMRKFQLADPRSYVLELVQAASLKGAAHVRFDIDGRDMQMQFDGRPFTADDFDDIYGAAFSRRLDRDVLARRQLALGVNSAMALSPTRVTVESGDGRAGARLSLVPDEEDRFEAIETERVGTVVHVRERFGLGTFVKFFKNISGTLAEEQLLRARCSFASFEIDLEGERLDKGLAPHKRPVLEPLRVERGETVVTGGLARKHEAVAWVDIVKDGVWISSHRLPTDRYPEGFVSVVQDHALRKDVSQSDVVRDEAYARMLDVVERCAHLALVRLAEGFEGKDSPPWAEGVLIRQILRFARGGTLGDEDTTGLREALLRLPLWETTAGSWVSLEDLVLEEERHGSIVYVNGKRFEGLVPPGHGFVVYMRIGRGQLEPLLAVLDALFEDRVREVSGLLKQIRANQRARKAWLARPMKPVLPEGGYLVRRSFEGPGLRGQVGITATQASDARVAYIVEGCLLCEEEIRLPLPGLRVVLESEDFEPTSSYDGIAPKAVACRAVLSILAQLGPLYAELARYDASGAWIKTCAMSFLRTALGDDDLAEDLADELGFPSSALAAARARMEASELTLSLGLGVGEPHPVTTMPLFRTLGSKRYSLADLTAQAKNGQTIFAVHKLVLGVDADVLVLPTELRESIEHLFPDGFESGWPVVDRIRKYKAFLERPAHHSPMELLPDRVVVPIEGEGIRGELAVMAKEGHLARRRAVQVLHEGRLIDSVEVLLVGTCVGWAESDKVYPKADYSGVKEGAGLDAVRTAILRAFAQACLQIAERARTEMTDDRRAFLREVLGLLFPSRAFRVAFDRIAGTKDVKNTNKAKIYRWLYAGVQAATNPTEFDQKLWRLTHSKTPAADAMAMPMPKRVIRWALSAVDVLFPSEVEPHELAKRALRPAAPLGALPVFTGHDGRAMSLDDLREHVERRFTVLFVDAPQAIDLGKRLVVVADEIHREQLRRILGAKQLLNGAGVIEREVNRKALQAQEAQETIGLAAGQASVSVRVLADGDVTSEGEVGLVMEHPDNPQRSRSVSLVIYRERKRIESFTVEDRPFELVAVLNDDRFALKFNNKEIRRDEVFEAALARCEEAVSRLIGTLVTRWDTLTPGVRGSVWNHILDFMVARRPSKVEQWLDESALDPMAAVVARLPGFPTVGGPLVSLVDLVKVERERGCIEVLPPPAQGWGRSPFGLERPIVAASAYELATLRALFTSVESVLEQWPMWKERERRRSQAREQSLPHPDGCLVKLDLPGPVVKGRLAIPGHDTMLQIDLCTEGRVLTSRVIDGVLPCVGSISGDGVSPDETWSEIRLRDDALLALRHAGVRLYVSLVRWYQQHVGDPRRTWAGGLLYEQVVALRGAERQGQLLPGQRGLFELLRPLAVIPLGDGRHISLDTALEERPAALGHLDLWDSAAAELLKMFDERDAQQPVQPPTATTAEVELDAMLEEILPTTPPTPEEQLLDAIRAELNLVRARNRSLLTHVHLDRIRIESLSLRRRSLVAWADDSGVVVNPRHAAVQRALARPDDPVWRSYVCSAVYTALNVWLEEVTDTDEMHFLGLMGQLVGSG